MKIGKNVTVPPDDEPGPFTLNRLEISLTSPRIIFIRGTLEEEILESRAFAAFVLFRDFNDHHAGGNGLEDFGESIVKRVDDILALLGSGRWNRRRRRDLGRRGED